MNIALRPVALLSGKTANVVGGYYSTVFALTPKETTASTVQQEQVQQGPLAQMLPSIAVYAPFVLFFALFIGAFGIQMITKAKSIKRIMTAFVIALFAASIPFVLSSTREGLDIRSKAGPAEIPQSMRIVQDTRSSAMVTWDTSEDKVGAVRISIAPYTIKSSSVIIGDSGSQVKTHTVKLENLKNGKTYEFEVLSGSVWYNDSGKPLILQMK